MKQMPFADGSFFQLSQWHQGAGQVLGGYRVQEVALVLGGVAGFVELRFAGAVGASEQPSVVARGEVGAAKAPYVVQGDPEFDFAVAEDVGVGRASGALLAEEVLENPVAVLLGEAHAVKRDGELACNGACVLEVLGCRAVGVVFVVPVAHEEGLDVVALFLEQEGCNGGIDASG
jgi:hypothetical protein